ncbi:PAS domain-containing protein [Methanooceanicella nereidis]|uniref:PAS domain-containing protein n=1 Tax=Methanooceanicella nereidis TaxID=2052831 RepID=UPI001E5E546E|nr:PAS domain-containing protein [Methanocella sp. CWC-04]
MEDLDTILKYHSGPMLIFDKGLKILHINREFLELLDITEDEFIDRIAEGSSIPLLGNPFIMSFLKDSLSGKEITHELSFRKDQKEHRYNAILIPVSFYDGDRGVSLILESICESNTLASSASVPAAGPHI